jgi:CRISPR-associated protein Csm3
MKLKEIKEIDISMKLLTGTRVGGNNDIIEIGGNDSPVVRNPLTKELYIPGSSIKGKMRMLMEWTEGKILSSGDVHTCSNKDCPICRVFGRGAKDSDVAKSGPTRISVKDAYLTGESKKELEKLRDTTGLDTEWKYENSINRLTSKANPRNSERIPAGTEFNFKITYKVLDMNDGVDDEKLFNEVVLRGLKGLLIEGIGGGVSRGNGQIEFTKLKVNGEDYLEKLENIKLS